MLQLTKNEENALALKLKIITTQITKELKFDIYIKSEVLWKLNINILLMRCYDPN